MSYRIEFTKSADKQLQKLPESEQVKIVKKIRKLADHPRPAGFKKLEGAVDLYRIRVGDYRVVYQIQDDILLITIVRVGDRKEIYRKGF